MSHIKMNYIEKFQRRNKKVFILGEALSNLSDEKRDSIFLPFISSAFVPTDTMPSAVRVFAGHQPVTPIVEAIRSLLADQPVGDDIWVALAWCIAIIAVAYIFAMRIYKKL